MVSKLLSDEELEMTHPSGLGEYSDKELLQELTSRGLAADTKTKLDTLLQQMHDTGKYFELMTFNDGWIASIAENAMQANINDIAVEGDTPVEAIEKLQQFMAGRGLGV